LQKSNVKKLREKFGKENCEKNHKKIVPKKNNENKLRGKIWNFDMKNHYLG